MRMSSRNKYLNRTKTISFRNQMINCWNLSLNQNVSPLSGEIKEGIIPGLILHEDNAIQDDTGMLYLDYRPLPAIFNYLSGMSFLKKHIDTNAEIKGWYRRAPIPYIEIRELKAYGKAFRSYLYEYKLFSCIFIIIISLTLLLI